MIEFRKTDDVAASAAAVAEEEILMGSNHEAWFVIFMQGAQPHPAAPAEGPARMPVMRLEIIQERNLLLQVIDGLAIHGLLASMGRIRQSAARSQARMVGERKQLSARMPAFSQQARLSQRRCTHRRSVEGSGERDGSLQCGAACSTGSPAAMRSQACWRQHKLKGADGANQSGRTVKVLLHRGQRPRRARMLSCCSSWAWRRRCPWPMMVSLRQTGHRLGSRSNGITPARCCPSSRAMR